MPNLANGRDVYGAADYARRWQHKTLATLLDEHAEANFDSVAIVVERLEDGERDVLSFGQYRRAVERIAGGLIELGVGPGDVVSVQLPNWWQLCAVAVAAARIGAVINPLIPIFREREVKYILGVTEAKVFIVPEAFRGFAHGDLAARCKKDLPSLRHVFTIGGEPSPGTESFKRFFLDNDWERTHATALAAANVDPDSAYQIMFTSGTTGAPKGVVHSHNTLIAAAEGVTRLWPLTREPHKPIYMVSTLGHQTAFAVGLAGSVVLGQKLVLHDLFSPREVLRSAQDERWSWTIAATPFLLSVAEEAPNTDFDLSSIDFVMAGGAPVPSHLAQQVKDRLGCLTATGYGMTETGSSTHTVADDPIERVANTVGRPVPGMEARVVGGDGAVLPNGSEGVLQMRGPNVAIDYFPDHSLYENAVHEGWLDTGDLATIDDAGYVSITGRAKDLIMRGGENIPVVDVENLLYLHPAVAQVAVVAVPDERLGERACACVVPKEGASFTFDDMIAHLKSHGLTTHYYPERLQLFDTMPMTAAGKVQKYRLRESLAGPGALNEQGA